MSPRVGVPGSGIHASAFCCMQRSCSSVVNDDNFCMGAIATRLLSRLSNSQLCDRTIQGRLVRSPRNGKSVLRSTGVGLGTHCSRPPLPVSYLRNWNGNFVAWKAVSTTTSPCDNSVSSRGCHQSSNAARYTMGWGRGVVSSSTVFHDFIVVIKSHQ